MIPRLAALLIALAIIGTFFLVAQKMDDQPDSYRVSSTSQTTVEPLEALSTSETGVTMPTTTVPKPKVKLIPKARSGPIAGFWDVLQRCECPSGWHCNTGNGYFGGLQFSLSSWRAVGGTGYPHEHSREVQIEMAERLSNGRRNMNHWPTCARKAGYL